jgi:hypothetical protein
VCEDERQYVSPCGQHWISPEHLRAGYRNFIRDVEPGIWSIVTAPHFGIGQRAFLIRTPEGNILWDCVTLLDQPTIDAVMARGGVQAIAISHPHFHSAMEEWSRTFDAPVWLHEDDRCWTPGLGDYIHYWSGETQPLLGGATLVRGGGHFPGYQVLHWPGGAAGGGALFAGDQPQVCMDTRWVTFLYSYPNMIPLGRKAVERIVGSLEPFAFERIHGAFGRSVLYDAKGAVRRSAERYLRWIAD